MQPPVSPVAQSQPYPPPCGVALHTVEAARSAPKQRGSKGPPFTVG